MSETRSLRVASQLEPGSSVRRHFASVCRLTCASLERPLGASPGASLMWSVAYLKASLECRLERHLERNLRRPLERNLRRPWSVPWSVPTWSVPLERLKIKGCGLYTRGCED